MATGLLDYKWIFIIGLCIFIFTDLQVAAAPVGTGVSCVTSVHPDGSASYRLSRPPPPPSHRCGTTWEDGNRIVIANDLERDPRRVTHLTNQSITLNVCVEHVIHGVECLSSGVSYKTECRANCAARKNKVTAGPVSSVSCVPSVHPDGWASYQLSQPPPPYHSCEATWEDGNKIVIAAGSDRYQSRVSHLTKQSITLNVCLGHVTYRVECFLEGIVYKTECRANCPARPNKVYLSGRPFPWWAGLIIALGVISIICGVLFGRRLCRRANPAETKDRPMDGVSEVSPMNGVSTTQV